jgi:hypothetical protein
MDEKPFGNLETDEHLSNWATPPTRPDPDRVHMAGCMIVSWTSIVILACLVVPFALFEPKTSDELFKVALIGGVPAALFGIVFSFAGRIPGFCGSVAGTGPSAVFIWLRIRELALGMPGVPDLRPAEYDVAYSWFMPLLLGVVLSAIWGSALALRLKLDR